MARPMATSAMTMRLNFSKSFIVSLTRVVVRTRSLSGSVDDKEGAVVVRRGAFGEAVRGSADGLDWVWGRELLEALDGAELDAVWAFGFGDPMTHEHQTGAER